jgi:choline dehydrogenase-like flavoprotein
LIYIIGSGLSGIAAAVALVRRGYRPTILDAGIKADPETSDLKARLRSVEPDAWTQEDLAQLKQMGPAASTGIPRKLHFGSNFVYREIDKVTSAQFDGASILRTFAQGGFSNVWGAVIQPWPQAEFRQWPVSFLDVERHYAHIRKLISPSEVSPRASVQAYSVHSDLQRSRRRLEAQGIRFNYADLAVRTSDDEVGKGCKHCGLCLYGCPYDSIFSASAQLARMVRQREVKYISNVLVDRVSIANDRIRIEGRTANHNAPISFNARSVFLATGLLESARIILNSSNTHPEPLRIQQSDIFTIPILRYHANAAISQERLHTLCQMIMEIDDSSVSSHPIQLQLYGYNDLYSQILRRRLGVLSRPLRPFYSLISDRMMVAFGYLHSNISSRMWITRSEGSIGRLQVRGDLNEETRTVGRAVVRKLFRIRNHFKAVPIPRQLRFDDPGGGHRSGGCFPMKEAPNAFETDRWGSLPRLPGLHVVDSSILPSIPAAPLAFTMMANAHRIASECPITDDE